MLKHLENAVHDDTANALWWEYAAIFSELWGLSADDAAAIGVVGSTMFGLEFKEYGPPAYATSVALPIRNAFYCAMVMHRRIASLENGDRLPLPEPVLDYGCGVGFMLCYLQELGHKDLYAYEVPGGVQHKVLSAMCKRRGINLWTQDSPARFGTVVCLNVLEHLLDPEHELSKLAALSDNIVANCDESEQIPHIAPMDARKRVNAQLHSRGWHIKI